ncbi:gamma-glutamyl-gamma-aminobutyrate hydrolase family protein [Asticcacaulis sp. EMRT-3]|uniref:gamma-glutamyl-gamma-aminobutyrate hydrolase family protein n=1 Tax=Asticcacaulis sp. EMRT-3 TaxID=3040349 RepID=UPI0024AF5001|nr:gamma-glutamyl-gamma-aminobutyrate hydrolase family protein [Asticcacaulis sp. EMRT-3]MDI7773994.1 gamma-glutamyl-gamma-aminobutyrate hydrolase family protein [Asticcacaulis sp. EMRT-3]
MKPVVGIIACNRTVGVENAHAVMERYTRAAMTYGDCHALLIPPLETHFSAMALTARLDGLMLTGSPSNVQPGLYGDTDSGEGPFDTGRDLVSMAMIEAMITVGKPVFGICRGFQEINVVLGGSLRRDVGSALKERSVSANEKPALKERSVSATQKTSLAHHAADDTPFDALFDHEHAVTLTPQGLLHHAYGRDQLRVNSVHYQGVDRLGDGLSIEALAADGLIEAFSANISGSQVLAVQWHPEWQTERRPDSQVFFALMGQALRGRDLGGQ